MPSAALTSSAPEHGLPASAVCAVTPCSESQLQAAASRRRRTVQMTGPVDLILSGLPEPLRRVAWQRFGLNLTYAQIGAEYGLSYQRATQLTGDAQRSVTRALSRPTRPGDTQIQTGYAALTEQFSALGPVSLVTLPTEVSAQVPGSAPEQLWNFALKLWQLRHPDAHAYPLSASPQERLFLTRALPAPDVIHRAFRSRQQFLTEEELAHLLGVPAEQVIMAAARYPFLRRTASGLYGSTQWHTIDLLHASAQLLLKADTPEWHYETIGRLAQQFAPELAGQAMRNFASAMARPKHAHIFTPAGLQGHWKLTQHSDGHTSNAAAIHAVLAASGPLHWQDIQPRLQRTIRPKTLLVILGRAPFIAVGRGTYTVQKHSGGPDGVPGPPRRRRRS